MRRPFRLALTSGAFVTLLLFPLGATAAPSDDDRDYTSRLERGVDFYSRGGYTEAAAYLATLTDSFPDRKEAFLWLGHARAQLKNWNTAREAYKRYAELAPTDAEGPRGVARTYESEGQPALAVIWYRRALELEPGNTDVRQTLSRLSKSVSEQSPAPAGSTAPPEPPDTNAQPPASEKSPTNKPGFWHSGLAGITGARTVWWGRLLALIFFVGSLTNGAAMQAKQFKAQYANAPAALVAFLGGIGSVIAYVIWWGIPEGTAWALLAVCAVISMGAASFGASQTR